jgi:hypothetical protein
LCFAGVKRHSAFAVPVPSIVTVGTFPRHSNRTGYGPATAQYPGDVARWTGEWLSAPAAGRQTAYDEPPRWPGERLGLPENGVGAAAGSGKRLLGLVVDLVLAGLLTSLFVRPEFADQAVMQTYNLWSLAVWAVITVVPVALFGFTPGMAVAGVRVGRLDGAQFVGLWRAVARAALTFLIIPAAVRNTDARGWHDRFTGTVVVRLR